jgi:hypothetical protein
VAVRSAGIGDAGCSSAIHQRPLCNLAARVITAMDWVASELEKALAKIKGRPGSIAGRPGGCRADWESMSVPFVRANDISH